jgi:4-hydroxy-2-oxoheptanedioate aldolase
MRRNVLREKIGRSRCAIGIYPGIVSPELVEVCGLLGFDWVFIDGEHGGVDTRACQELLRAADRAGAGTLIRVPSADPSVILGYLETGACAVTVPHITNSDQARAALAAGRYPPAGTRGAGSSTPAADYGLTQTATEYFARANEEVWILPQIEDADAVRNIREILAVPGVEGIVVGPGDLAASMGLPGQPGHPDVMKAVDAVFAEARSAKKHVGTVAATPAAMRAFIDKGADFMLCSALPMFASAARQFLSEVRAGTNG